MGREKGPNRSKFTASSSSQAAQLANQNVHGSSTVSRWIQNASTVAPVVDNNADTQAEVAVVLKKFSKKDPTTRCKALTELVALTSRADSDSVANAVLPHWAGTYNLLWTDDNVGVRVELNNTLAHFAPLWKKSLGPHLKKFMCAWICCQCDPAKDVAASAKAAFDAAIPPQKHANAIAFCAQEITDDITDNLSQSLQTFADTDKTTALDEKRFNRFVSSNVLAASFLLSACAGQPIGETIAPRLLSAVRIPRLLQSKAPEVRKATYALIRDACIHNKEAFHEHIPTINDSIFAALGEKATQNMTLAWECVLSVCKNYGSDAWPSEGSPSAAFKRIFALLKQGAHGSAGVTYPSLLPFLSFLPQDSPLLTSSKTIGLLFDSIWEGSTTPFITQHEGVLLLRASWECLVFLTKNGAGELASEATRNKILQRHFVDKIHDFVVSGNTIKCEQPVFVGLASKVYAQLCKLSGSAEVSELICQALLGPVVEAQEEATGIQQTDRVVEVLSAIEAVGASSGLYTRLSAHFGQHLKENQTAHREMNLISQLLAHELFAKAFLGLSPTIIEEMHAAMLNRIRESRGSVESLSAAECSFVGSLVGASAAHTEHSITGKAFFHQAVSAFVSPAPAPAQREACALCLERILRSAAACKPINSLGCAPLDTFVVSVGARGATLTVGSPELGLLETVLTQTVSDADNPFAFLADASSVVAAVSSALLKVQPTTPAVTTCVGAIVGSQALLRSAERLSQERKRCVLWLVEQALLISNPAAASLWLAACKNGLQPHSLCAHRSQVVDLLRNSLSTDSGVDAAKWVELACATAKIFTAECDWDKFRAWGLAVEVVANLPWWTLPDAASRQRVLGVVSSVVTDSQKAQYPVLTVQESQVAPSAIAGLTTSERFAAAAIYLSCWEAITDEVVLPSTQNGCDVQTLRLRLELGRVHASHNSFLADIAPSLENVIGSVCQHLFSAVVTGSAPHPTVSVEHMLLCAIVGVDLVTSPKIALQQLAVASSTLKRTASITTEAGMCIGECLFSLLAHAPQESISETVMGLIGICLDHETSGAGWELVLAALLRATKEPAALDPKVWLWATSYATPENSTKLGFELVVHSILSTLFKGPDSDTSVAMFVSTTNQELPSLLTKVCNELTTNYPNVLGTALGTQFADFGQVHSLLCATNDIAGSFESVEITKELGQARTALREQLVEHITTPTIKPKWRSTSGFVLVNQQLCRALTTFCCTPPQEGDVGIEQRHVELLFGLLHPRLAADLDTYKAAFAVLTHHFNASRIDALCEVLKEEQNDDEDDTASVARSMARTVDTLMGETSIVNALFPVSFAEGLCTLPPQSASDTAVGDDAVLLYMVRWLLLFYLLQRVHASHTRQATEFATWVGSLRKHAFDRFMDLLVRHLPLTPQQQFAASSSSPIDLTGWLQTFGEMDLEHKVREKLACELFQHALTLLPALTRSWWATIHNHQLTSEVLAFTATNVTDAVVQKEIEAANNSAAAPVDDIDTEGLVVKGKLLTREVVAVYAKGDDAVLEVIITLPDSFPLQAAQVRLGRQDGLTEARARKWVMLVSALLTSQNGSIWEAILLWKGNVDKMFEGVEPCPICYSTIHMTTHALPKKQCRTCKNKFHNACLLKWFSSSHKSVCPLCQTSFL